MGLRASLIEIYRRIMPLGKEGADFIYLNGENNLYPYEIEGVISNSPTAYRASLLNAKFIAGAGVLNEETDKVYTYKELPFVNKKKAYKITDIINMSAEDLSTQGGSWFHVGWGIGEDGLLKQTHIDVLPYCRPRKAKEDDDKNLGKIYFKDWRDKAKFGQKKSQVKWFYPYSPDLNVVKTQIKADAGLSGDLEDFTEAIKKYRGQVFYLNLTPRFEYALSPFDSVYNDCDTEYRMGLYTNKETREGFMGKVIVVTSGLDEQQEKNVNADIGEWLGSEDAGNIQIFNAEAGADPTKVVFLQQLKPQLDDDRFVNTDKRIKRHILGVADNIPEPMIYASDGMFGTTEGAFEQYKLFYSEQTEPKREKLQETLAYLGFPVIIEPIVRKVTVQTPTP